MNNDQQKTQQGVKFNYKRIKELALEIQEDTRQERLERLSHIDQEVSHDDRY